MSEHLSVVLGFDGTLKQLAEEIAHLGHSARAELILFLMEAIRAEAANDFAAGRVQLAGKNFDLAAGLLAAWRISNSIAELTAKHPEED
ncbi:MAG: hypothetical protein WCG48_01215 [Candidatus Berkelbacteria bacterium]